MVESSGKYLPGGMDGACPIRSECAPKVGPAGAANTSGRRRARKERRGAQLRVTLAPRHRLSTDDSAGARGGLRSREATNEPSRLEVLTEGVWRRQPDLNR